MNIISSSRRLINSSANLIFRKDHLRLTPRPSSNLFPGGPSILTNCQTTYHNLIFLSGAYGVMNKLGRAYYSSHSKQSNKSVPLRDDQEIKVAVCYDNAELAKSQIISDNRGRAGVYR